MLQYFHHLSFSEICEKFLDAYNYSHGEAKMEEILSKVEKSKNVQNIFEQSIKNNLRINFKVIAATINSLPFFIFSKGETLALGEIIMLCLWHENINQYRVENKMTDGELKYVALTIIQECTFWFSKRFNSFKFN